MQDWSNSAIQELRAVETQWFFRNINFEKYCISCAPSFDEIVARPHVHPSKKDNRVFELLVYIFCGKNDIKSIVFLSQLHEKWEQSTLSRMNDYSRRDDSKISRLRRIKFFIWVCISMIENRLWELGLM